MIDRFDRGRLRSKSLRLPLFGKRCRAADGVELQFALEVADAVIRRASFQATTCTTLIAYAETLSQWISGMPLRDAARITPGCLVERLPGVAPSKRDRATLAVRALQWAIVEAARDLPPVTSRKELRDA